MRPRTRLDPVVKLEEQKEEQRRRELADASRRLRGAEEALTSTRARAAADQRRRAAAADWQLAELAHGRALCDVRIAETAVESAAAESTESRDRYAAAHARAEALRRIAELRAQEIVAAREATERKELDELNVLRFPRAERDAA